MLHVLASWHVRFATAGPPVIGARQVLVRRARAPGGPAAAGAVEGIPWAARSRIFGAGRRRERRGRQRRKSRENALRRRLAADRDLYMRFFNRSHVS